MVFLHYRGVCSYSRCLKMFCYAYLVNWCHWYKMKKNYRWIECHKIFRVFHIHIYLSGFAKKDLAEFLATVLFGACSAWLDHFFLMVFSVQKSPKKLRYIKKDVFNMLYTSSPPPPPLSPLAIISHNSLLVIKHYDIWNQCTQLKLFLVVG